MEILKVILKNYSLKFMEWITKERNKGASVCARIGWVGQAQYDLLVRSTILILSVTNLHKTLTEAISEPREHRAGIVNEVNSQCEAFLVSERIDDLPQA